MTSFIRTIQREELPSWIEEVLSRRKSFLPLPFFPGRALPGDFVYLAFRGSLVGRARILNVEETDDVVRISSIQRPFRARSKMHYTQGWSRAPGHVPFRGYQGIRYVDTMGLSKLDLEEWPSHA